MLNSIIYAGNTAYEGTMGTHERNIQEINRLTIDEICYARNNSSNVTNFYNHMANYNKYVTSLAANRGISVFFDYTSFNFAAKSGDIEITYADSVVRSKYKIHINAP